MTDTIRAATEEDETVFFDLWIPLMQTLAGLGGDIAVSERSIAFFRSLFRSYVSGETSGVALLAVEPGGAVAGALLWGASPEIPVDGSTGTQVMGWGLITHEDYRGKGINRRLQEAAITELDRQGIDVVVGAVLLTNPRGIENSRSIGFRPTQLLGTLNLHEEAESLQWGQGDYRPEKFYWQGTCPLCNRDEPDDMDSFHSHPPEPV